VRNWVSKHDKNKGGAHKSKKDYDRKDRSKMEEEFDYLNLDTQLNNLQVAIHVVRQLQQNCNNASLWTQYQEEIDTLNKKVEELTNDKSEKGHI
jgi:hypothetical protein